MFFTHISQLMTQGVDLTIVIRRKENELIVSTLPKSNGLKDDAQHHIVPLTLTGTPAELDAGFMQTIAQPVQKATGLIVNLEQFEQQMTKASANSKAAKDAQAKESKEEKEKRERCEKSIKRADELIAVQKFDEALSNLQQARLYATEQTRKTVDEKITEVKAKLNQGSLFAMEEIPPQQPSSQVAPPPMPQVPPMQQVAPQQVTPLQPQQPPQMHPPRQVMQQVTPQMQPPANSHPQQHFPQEAAPTAPTKAVADEYLFPPTAVQTFDPEYCRSDEYEQYPDFPVNMQAPTYNHATAQTF